MTRKERAKIMVAERNAKVLEAAVAEAQATGFANLRRRPIADRAGVSQGSVNQAFGDMAGLRESVMTAAVQREILPILAAGVIEGHTVACGAPAELQQRALDSLKPA